MQRGERLAQGETLQPGEFVPRSRGAAGGARVKTGSPALKTEGPDVSE
jgi:hypothetical protein